MEQTLEFLDHRQKSNKYASFILILFSIISLIFFIPVIYSVSEEANSDSTIILFVLIPVFLAFTLMPLVILKLTKGKPKKTILSVMEKKIKFFEGKTLVAEFDFGQIQSLKQSRYTYTVKTKNGTRTVTVYTTLSPEIPDRILAEATNFNQARLNSETIAKILKISITNEQGEKREYAELDIPFHKRSHPDIDMFTPPNFSTETNLSWRDTGTEFKIISSYNPSVFRIVGICLSVALFLIIQLAIGDMSGLGIFYWETFPPDISHSIFFLMSALISFIPVGYVYYNGHREKIILINNEGVSKDKDFISFNKLEEIILEDNNLLLIGDEHTIRISLYFFCKNEDYNTVRLALIYAILSKTNGGVSESFVKFQTEF